MQLPDYYIIYAWCFDSALNVISIKTAVKSLGSLSDINMDGEI